MDELDYAEKNGYDQSAMGAVCAREAQLKFHASRAVFPGNEIWRSFGVGTVTDSCFAIGRLLEMPARLLKVKVSLSLPSSNP